MLFGWLVVLFGCLIFIIIYFIFLPCVWTRALWGAAAALLSPGAASPVAGAVPWHPGGSGHRDFPFLTIIGNGPAQPRHSLSTLYGIYSAHRAGASGSSSGLGAAAGHGTSGVLRVLMGTSTNSSGCACVTTVQENRAQILTSSQHPQAEPLGVEGRELLGWIFIGIGVQNETVLLMSKWTLVLPG